MGRLQTFWTEGGLTLDEVPTRADPNETVDLADAAEQQVIPLEETFARVRLERREVDVVLLLYLYTHLLQERLECALLV